MAGSQGTPKKGIWGGRKVLLAAADALQRLAAVVNFEVFRDDLGAAMVRSDWAKGPAVV